MIRIRNNNREIKTCPQKSSIDKSTRVAYALKSDLGQVLYVKRIVLGPKICRLYISFLYKVNLWNFYLVKNVIRRLCF